MNKFILILSFIIVTFNAQAIEELPKQIADDVREYVTSFIPGEGPTEVSLELRENYKPDFSVLGVRELDRNDSGNTFWQFSFYNTEKNNDDRLVGNLGLGKRYLTNNNLLMTGFNAFVDYDHVGNSRASIGAEIKNSVLALHSNYYKKIYNGKEDERVLDGYDIQLTSQVPYLHWADIFYNTYKWEAVIRDDIEGSKIGTDLLLTPHLALEAAFDDKDLKGHKDEWYAKIIFTHPPREGATARDGVSDNIWKEEKDMSGELLTKVKRNNKIMIEFTGSATISRAD